MDPAGAVGAPRRGVHGADLLGQPGMADRALRRRAGSPLVVARLGHRQQPAGQLHGQSFCGHRGYGRVPPFGSCGSRSSSRALFRIATSFSSSRMRLLAAASSACSARFRPGSWPVSISSCLRQHVDRLVTDAQIGSDLGDGAASGHQVEHLTAELLGITLGHGHGSFDGRRDQKSSKPTPCNPGHIRIGQLRHCFGFLVARSSLQPSLVGANLRVWGRAAGNSRVRREGLQLRSDQLRVVTHREVVAARHLHLAHIGVQRPPSPLEPQRVVELTEDRQQRPIGQ